MVTRVHESTWPNDADAERTGAPYVVVLGETAAEASRHESAEEALESARAFGPGAAVWREDDLEGLGEGGPLAETVED